jgi:hypothetical protein
VLLFTLPVRTRRTPQKKDAGQKGPFRRLDSRLRAFGKAPLSPRARIALMVAVLAGLLVAGWLALGYAARGVEPRAFEQHRSNAGTELLPGTTIAQSFRSPRDGLSRLDFEMNFSGVLPPDGTFSLREGDGLEGRAVYTAPLTAGKTVQNIYLSYSFPPISNSGGMTYTAVLRAPGDLGERIGLRYNSFDTFSSGRLYSSGGPQEGDLAFAARYTYTVTDIVGDLLVVFTRDLPVLIAWLAALILPGLALLTWLPNRLQGGQRWIAVPGVSALLWPVFFLVTRAVGFGVNGLTLWFLMLICAVLVVAKPLLSKQPLVFPKVGREDWAFWGSLGGLLFLTLASRLLALRDAAAGMGLDAYHHTLIAQMFIDRGGVPSDYEPYAPLASYTYHYGFHALTAVVGWLSGRDNPDGLALLMPQAGQVGTALPVLTLTLFCWRSLGNRWAGLAAGALAGLVSVFPAFYVNWSRYTQGWGLALLPVAWVLLLECLNWRERNPTGPLKGPIPWEVALSRSAPYLLAVVGTVGLFLTHYRIVVIYALFTVLYLLWRLFASLRARQPVGETVQPLWRGLVVAALSVAALLPWLINLRQNFATNFVSRVSDTSLYYDLTRTVGPDLLNHYGLALMIALSLGGVGWAIRRRDPLPLLPLIVWLILFVWSSPYLWGVRLPLAGYLDITTLMTGLWLPTAILAGYTLQEAAKWALSLGDTLSARAREIWVGVATRIGGAVALLLAVAALFHLGSWLDNKPYITEADMAAMRWMRGNVPSSAYVLANPFAFEWDKPPNQSVHGSDAGLWVPLLAARGTGSSVPPLPAYNERKRSPNYIDDLRNIIGFEPFEGRPADWEALKRGGATHLYVGSRGGAFNLSGLLESDDVELLFHRDAVWLFRLR